ncbi:isochorismatase family protein [Microtetraspora sp. NBRC 16547]|uniref:isochorismatase family protein n=1 Tax=Microtetraspora sp. NBRC 16547 TaxID=3030993 RepID=UPI0024A3B3F9|nr:isochorismatase family protein [Microtetraspora sp. NBRC 16547]GLW96457.1 hydrolase [Microtetraspora sp. NBRC 16547]
MPIMEKLDPRRTALLLIDLMTRIVEQPTSPHSGPAVVARSLALADAVRKAGGLVVSVRAERPGVAEQPPGSELVEGVLGDLEIVKRTWGAFHNTGLEEALRKHTIDTLIITGIATNFGVEQTARFADELGFKVILPEDAVTALDAHAHEFAFGYIFPRIATVCTTAEIVAALD